MPPAVDCVGVMTNTKKQAKIVLHFMDGRKLEGKGIEFLLKYAAENLPEHIINRAFAIENGVNPAIWSEKLTDAGQRIEDNFGSLGFKIVRGGKNAKH